MAQPAQQRNLGRMSEIAQVAVRHGFGYFLETHRLTHLLPWPRRPAALDAELSPTARGQHLREMLDELGPTFVKFGQLLSTRPDIVPPDIITELRALQDDVKPFPFSEVQRVIGEELELPLEKLFLEFEEQPMAAASIGQVHRAVLPNGRRVAVKVQRPEAPRKIEADLALLYQAARLAKERLRALDFIDARELVDEFARSIRHELDYRQEGRNAQAFHRHFAGHPHVRIPRVYWSYSRQRVLTLEMIQGTQLADIELDDFTLEERNRLATLLTETWMTMIFRNGFFHGDPHPANILVISDDQIGLVDFGQAGKLSDDDISKMTALFIDAASENVDVLAKRLGDLGVRYERSREAELQAELRELYYKYYGARLAEIDPMQVVREAFALIYSQNLRLPTRFVILDKAIATLASVTTELHPDFNVFEVAKPYARDLMMHRYTPHRMLRRATKETRALAQVIRETPYQWHEVLEQARHGQLELVFRHKGLDELAHKLDVVFNRLVIALVVAGGLIGSSLIGIFAKNGPHVMGLHVISFIGFLLSGILGVWLLIGVVKSGRL
jgi:ubiquinone biosynthesis protein